MKKEKIDRRIARSTKALKKAFIELLDEKDYKDISINDILERADYSKPTFYNHYNGKDDFVDHIINDAIQDLDVLIQNGIRRYSNLEVWDEKVIEKFFEERFNYIYNERELYTALFTYPCFVAFRHKLQIYIDELYLPNIVLFPSAKIKRYKFHSYIISHIFVGALDYWVKENFELSPKYFTKMYVNTFYTEPETKE